MNMQEIIEHKLKEHFSPLHLEVINESGNHNVPPGSESHFKVTLISQSFEGANLLARHRLVNKVLAEELHNQIHALALHTMTPEEWFNRGGTSPVSPECLGGMKHQNK